MGHPVTYMLKIMKPKGPFKYYVIKTWVGGVGQMITQ